MNTAAHPDDPKHLAVCPVCQAHARQQAGELGIDLYRVWTRVAAEVWSRQPGRVETLAARLLRSPGLARALVTTPSLLLSWVGASVVVLLAGIAATHGTGTAWVQLLAPVIAAAGIAYAYGPGIDPAFELSRSLAVGDRMVLLTRALAVFGLNALLGLAASAAGGAAAGVTFGWLAPMTALSALALAVAVWSHAPAAGVGAALAVWSVVVLASEVGAGDPDAAVAAALAPIYLVCALLCAGFALAFASGKRERRPAWGR